ncbi:hypothetical protein HW555_003462 [Spodoptera exigua]|uniref:Regulatory protein zeste n=1 Tax=Spodoptera exigua TaxID=7107 RepID=A0A835GMT9_SPOEX|nr:hypothetical protein HW555_003462 [Spodoptera exigua]
MTALLPLSQFGPKPIEMSRNAAPSLDQLEKLVSFLENKPWLAMGHARTANARIRSRQAWSEITTALNSDGSGCMKTSEQWCKYWKDKKGAVKRKSSLIAAARRRTGGGIEEDLPQLSEIELKIQTIMGGESFGCGDQNLEINPFEQEPLNRTVESEESPSILLNIVPPNVQQANQSEEPGHEMQWSNLAAFDVDSVQDNLAQIPQVPPAPDAHSPEAEENRVSLTELARPVAHANDVLERGSQTPTRRVHSETVRGRRRTHQLSPRQSASRRRLLRRSPPSQRRSEMVSITERFIAIEERRAQAELLIAQAISQQVEGYRAMAQALDNISSVIRDYINK